LGIDASGSEIGGVRISRLFVGASVPIETEVTAEVSNHQIFEAVAINVNHPGT
jgi:hypothetical protein